MPGLKSLACAAVMALTIPLSASAQPAPPAEPPAASAPDAGGRYDNRDEPRWRGREFRRDRFSDREDGEALARTPLRPRRGRRRRLPARPAPRTLRGRHAPWRGAWPSAVRCGRSAWGTCAGPTARRMSEMMIMRIERATQPTTEQRPAFDKLKEASAEGQRADARRLSDRARLHADQAAWRRPKSASPRCSRPCARCGPRWTPTTTCSPTSRRRGSPLSQAALRRRGVPARRLRRSLRVPAVPTGRWVR